jgi:hypothetical protein
MRQLGLIVYKPDKTFHGYTLFAPMRRSSAYLIDMQGAIVHRWQLPYRPGDYGYLLDNGHLLISGQTGKGPVAFGGRGGILMELDWGATSSGSIPKTPCIMISVGCLMATPWFLVGSRFLQR